MGETNGNHRSIFSMRSTAAPPPSRAPRGRTQMAKSIARFLVAVMAVAAMILASAAGTGLAQVQTNTSTDRDALVALYNATSGDSWANNDNWLSDKPLGEWHGVTTDSDGRVRRLNLSGNQLSGEVPSELGSLSNLEWLWLQRNQLSEVPSELGSLSNLEWLDLSGNQLTEIPGELGNLSNLEFLYLSSNELTGCIPEGLRDVANNDFQILGLDFCEVDSSDPLIVRYDANNNGTIEKIEVIAAINDYLFGEGDEAISKSDVIKLINFYLFG